MSDMKELASVEAIAAGFASAGAPLTSTELADLEQAHEAWDGRLAFDWKRSGTGVPGTYRWWMMPCGVISTGSRFQTIQAA